MKGAFALAALAGLAAAVPAPQVTAVIAPSESTPSGCSVNYSGEFEISIVNASATTTKRDLTKRKALTMTLANGVLTDDEGRTGYIASNNQFQFDKPAQTGAIYTAGWSVCSNGTLALGDSAIFYECLSGTFYNLYDASTGAQCSEIYIDVISVSSSSSATSTATATQIADGQIQIVSQISDGQIQATTGTSKAAVVTQISDGQIQAATTSKAVVSQISDGQIQATSAGTVTAVSSKNSTTVSTAKLSTYTGAAAFPTVGAGVFAAAGALAFAML